MLLGGFLGPLEGLWGALGGPRGDSRSLGGSLGLLWGSLGGPWGECAILWGGRSPLEGPKSNKPANSLCFNDLELIPGISGSARSAGSGVIYYGSGPPFHVRRGSG